MATGHEGEKTTDLKHLGPGEGSKVEHIKLESQHLRGKISEQLQAEGPRFTEDQTQLIKFHGIYQQEDRDARQQRKAAHTEKAYQFMVRSRIPGGALTAEQYLTQDEISEQYANGTLRITTRQSLQLHGILKGDLKSSIAAINQSLLSTLAACGDVNRNVMACPAPISNRAQARVQEIAHAIAMRLAPRSTAYHEIWIDGEKVETIADEKEVEPIYGATYLPRKFKIGVAFPGDNCIDIYTQDVGLIARLEGEQLAGFTLVIGGGMGMTHGKSETYPRLAEPLCDVTPDEALNVVETIMTVQRDYGDRTNRKHARMKYVVEERGIDWFRQQVEERLGYQLQAASPVHIHAAEDHLGWHQQANGNWFLGLHVQNGRIHDKEGLRLKSGLREVIKRYRPELRLTAQQNIMLLDIQEADRVEIEAQLHSYGIETDPTKVGHYRFAMACPALPTCGLALAEAERALPDIVQALEEPLRALGLDGEPLSMRMTGCPNGCARPYMGDIGFVGRSKNLYNIYVGGDLLNTRMNTLYAASVHTEDLVAAIEPLLAFWKAERHPQEGFGDFCHRVGIERLRDEAASPSLLH
ncbi:NADPH-dependent assimilatory sulfite reductase hemoprotein subunit [Ktedonospora formicarum]|uniref:Sulfite reductase subunit beta n=1 Tax=Ktedonospora formicarum TaxID=2778364 RepID=A0A8J3I164_9CHLR|nr:NADPH-dependent assimilatory sulfite reductase hemoprotein subunit [Ktedonospora formicarum]GHO44895.1 sulfite reductase subunit beta [Ktedonospora formicarum]